ncbi:MAG TPA: response regulator, partial [Pirellulales bacterium]
KDNGAGISAEMLPKVFDLFTQVDATLDRSQGGLGIGLTLVRSLVELHGGSVAVESGGPGMGSEFTVRLPALPETVRRVEAEDQPLADLPAPHGRVLIVDDNADAAASLAMLLTFCGDDVRTASGGAKALELAREFRPRIVLLDIGLPGMDGYDLARRLREQPGGDGLLLIAITGYGQEEDRRRSVAAGFDHHLIKPVDLNALQEVLRSIGPAPAGTRRLPKLPNF